MHHQHLPPKPQNPKKKHTRWPLFHHNSTKMKIIKLCKEINNGQHLRLNLKRNNNNSLFLIITKITKRVNLLLISKRRMSKRVIRRVVMMINTLLKSLKTSFTESLWLSSTRRRSKLSPLKNSLMILSKMFSRMRRKLRSKHLQVAMITQLG